MVLFFDWTLRESLRLIKYLSSGLFRLCINERLGFDLAAHRLVLVDSLLLLFSNSKASRSVTRLHPTENVTVTSPTLWPFSSYMATVVVVVVEGLQKGLVASYTSSKCAGVEEELEDGTERSH